jgi:hypothetical protein
MVGKLHMIIDVHFGRLPCGELKGRTRQGLQRSAFELLEQRTSGDRLATELTVIDDGKLLGDSRVAFGEREELTLAQRSENPVLGDLNRGLDGGLHVRLQLPAVAVMRNDSV